MADYTKPCSVYELHYLSPIAGGHLVVSFAWLLWIRVEPVGLSLHILISFPVRVNTEAGILDHTVRTCCSSRLVATPIFTPQQCTVFSSLTSSPPLSFCSVEKRAHSDHHSRFPGWSSFFQVWIWWTFCSDWIGSVPSLAQLVISGLILQSQPIWWWSHHMKACSFWITEWNNFRILLAVLIFQKSYTAWVEWW